MKKKNSIEKCKKNNSANRATIVGMILFSFLSFSCAGNKQALPVSNESEISKGGGDPELECRWRVPTGSTLRQKVCATKAAWERMDRRQRKDADRFYDDVVDEMRQKSPDFGTED